LAFNISSWVPGIVGTAVRYVSVPSFSRLAEPDAESLALGVRLSVPALMAVILPAAIVMATLARSWWIPVRRQMGPVGSRAALLGGVDGCPHADIVGDRHTGRAGRHQVQRLAERWAVALVPTLWIGAHVDGIRGAAIAHGVVAVFVALPLAVLALRVAGVSLVQTVPALMRPTIGAAIAAVLLLIDSVVNGNSFVQLSLAGGAGMIVYILVVVPLDKLRQVTALRAHFR
jgi:hypothetical protein